MASALAICLLLSISLQSFAWLSLSPVKMWHKIPHVMCAPDYDFPMNQVQRSEVPTRYDSCKMLITGVVGTDPREVYMKNRHYVINFAVSMSTRSHLLIHVSCSKVLFYYTACGGGTF